MADLGQAYVQIIPSAKGISGAISSIIEPEATSSGKSAGINIGSAIKAAIAAAGIGEALKSALEAGGNLQQSFGGLDTLYGDAAKAAKEYAVEAAQAGISANSYAEQAVSFGAALKSAFGGDTVKAAEAANVAILDMADNSAKMGTDITSIQTAYQGFAKQNYTMLDNLKLGYGGTKAEMERLLADAEKLSGVKYNIDNLGDVYSAIHVIQENLGLTGVAAEEAATTFTGSLGAMKAAGENLLANLALGENITPALNTLGETVRTFVFDNLFPMIGNILSALPELLSGLGSMIIQALNITSNNAGEIVALGLDIVTSLVSAIIEAAPYLIEAAVRLVAELGKALIETDWVTLGTNTISKLSESLSLAASEIFGSDTSIVDSVLDTITRGLPNLLDKGIEIITNVANGVLSNLPLVISTVGEVMTTFTDYIMKNYPVVLEKGATLIVNLVQGVIKNLPKIVEAVVKVIASFTETVLTNLPKILQSGIEILLKLVAGIIEAIPQLIAAIPQVISAIVEAFGSFDWGTIGHNLMEGIKDGIVNGASMIVDAAKDAASAAFDAAKDFLGISSPAKKGIYIGEMLGAGFAEGIDDSKGEIQNAINGLNADTVDSLNTTASANLNVNRDSKQGQQIVLNMNIYGADGQPISELADLIQERIFAAIQSKELTYA